MSAQSSPIPSFANFVVPHLSDSITIREVTSFFDDEYKPRHSSMLFLYIFTCVCTIYLCTHKAILDKRRVDIPLL